MPACKRCGSTRQFRCSSTVHFDDSEPNKLKIERRVRIRCGGCGVTTRSSETGAVYYSFGFETPGKMYVCNVHVPKEFRRRHLASELINELLRRHPSVETIHTSTFTADGLSFWSKYGEPQMQAPHRDAYLHLKKRAYTP